MSTLQDYARSAVPDNQRVSGWYIGFIYIGVGLALPAFLVASTIAMGLGFYSMLLAVFVSGIILSAVGAVTGTIDARVRVSTYWLIQNAFGRWPAYLINILLVATMFGWFILCYLKR